MRYTQNTLILSLLLFFTGVSWSQVQCDVDVTIAEGNSIQMCSNALVPLNASSGYASYSWTGPETGVTQSFTPSQSGQYVVAAEDAIGCISNDTIQVTVLNVAADSIVSSNGDTLCGSGSTTLSLANTYSLYDWGGGVNTPTFTATQPGTYSVNVADANNCVATFTYQIFDVEFDVEVFAGDACSTGAYTLQGTGGDTYSWSTGETTQSITVYPSEETNYTVIISSGTCSEMIVTTLTPLDGAVEYELQDTFYVAGGETLQISGPAGFDSYSWWPGDQLLDTAVQVVTFNGTESQTLYMSAVHPDGCTWTASTVIIVVNLDVPNGFSPNGDFVNDFFYIPELDHKPGKLVVWNRWGDIVYQSDLYDNSWQGTCETGFCFGSGENLPEGTYFYQVDVYGITKEGYITIKR